MNILHLAVCPIVHIIVSENSVEPLQKFHIDDVSLPRSEVVLASDWLKIHSIRRTTQIWILRRRVT